MYFFFVRKREGKKPVVRSRHRWGDDTRMDLRKKEWKGVDWIHLAEDK
jgi:hypothetical protein